MKPERVDTQHNNKRCNRQHNNNLHGTLNAHCRYAECDIFIVVLSVIMPSVIMPSVVVKANKKYFPKFETLSSNPPLDPQFYNNWHLELRHDTQPNGIHQNNTQHYNT